jgi:predicted phage terminase large subunit-like protein
MNVPAQVQEALVRQRLFPMVIMAFAMLHPGKPPLRHAWYLLAMCWWLERVARGELLLSMIWLQPRALKSITVAIVFPCWLLGRDPTLEIMVATYGETLSREHAEKRRQIMESDWYKRIFPRTRIATVGNTLLRMKTTAGGGCRSVSVGGPVTGRGADMIILDDCMKSDDAKSEAAREEVKNWFSSALWTRRNDKTGGAVISIQQRVHEDDLPAFLLDKGFACLNLPAIADRDYDIGIGEGRTYHWKRGELLDPIRFPSEVLETERLNLGPQNYSAQYLQNPIAPEGNLLNMEHFKRFEGRIERRQFDRVIQSWDPAATDLPTSDWSVCTTWGYLAGRIFLLNIYRQRVPYPKLKQAVITQRMAWNADHVIIERSSNGLPLVQQLSSEGPFRPGSWPPAGMRQLDKAERLLAQTGQIEEGRVWLPAHLEGLDCFLSELRAFPNGRFDDQVDSLTQVLEFLFWKWKKLAEERNSDGRLKEHIRGKRPHLPPLPEWIAPDGKDC